MRRREFITLVGGAAAMSSNTWPLRAHAQQPAVPVVGYILAQSFELNERSAAAFRKGLGAMGFVEGRNVAIEYRAAANDYGRLPELAADMVRRRVAVIYAAGGSVSALAVKAVTGRIPIVFTIGDDPVASVWLRALTGRAGM